MCNVVLVSGYGERRHRRSPTCSCSLEYVHHTGERIRDYEEKYKHTDRYEFDSLFPSTHQQQDDVVREQNNNGNVTQ